MWGQNRDRAAEASPVWLLQLQEQRTRGCVRLTLAPHLARPRSIATPWLVTLIAAPRGAAWPAVRGRATGRSAEVV